jgi:hypothetical protein
MLHWIAQVVLLVSLSATCDESAVLSLVRAEATAGDPDLQPEPRILSVVTNKDLEVRILAVDIPGVVTFHDRAYTVARGRDGQLFRLGRFREHDFDALVRERRGPWDAKTAESIIAAYFEYVEQQTLLRKRSQLRRLAREAKRDSYHFGDSDTWKNVQLPEVEATERRFVLRGSVFAHRHVPVLEEVVVTLSAEGGIEVVARKKIVGPPYPLKRVSDPGTTE